jgi:hypothetical protein
MTAQHSKGGDLSREETANDLGQKRMPAIIAEKLSTTDNQDDKYLDDRSPYRHPFQRYRTGLSF